MPRDPRQYARISVDLPLNDKFKGAPVQSKWLALTGVLWSTQNLTDGHVDPAIVAATAGVANRYVRDLVTRNAWHTKGHDCPDCPQPKHDGELVIHHFLVHQDDAETVQLKRADKSRAARMSNHNRWNHGGPFEECAKCAE